MSASAAFDWSGYLRGLPDDETRVLAVWLAAHGLGVGEFMEVVERKYAAAPADRLTPPQWFIETVGRRAAEGYARRKRRFAALVAALELALMSGALPGRPRVQSTHWVDGPPPPCAEAGCGRPASHFYRDAATGAWRYGCEQHMRQRRADAEQVAYVMLRGKRRDGQR